MLKYITAFQFAMGACILLCASGRAVYAQHEDSCGEQAVRQKKETALRSTVMEILQSIRSKDPSSFVKHVDKDGIGIWGGKLSVSEIRREFRQKSGIYCLLFSSSCVISTTFPTAAYINTQKWKISYSEWLAKNSSPKIEIEMFYGGEAELCHANVAIRARQKSQLMEEPLSLDLRIEETTSGCSKPRQPGLRA